VKFLKSPLSLHKIIQNNLKFTTRTFFLIHPSQPRAKEEKRNVWKWERNIKNTKNVKSLSLVWFKMQYFLSYIACTRVCKFIIYYHIFVCVFAEPGLKSLKNSLSLIHSRRQQNDELMHCKICNFGCVDASS
jgi:hypothetical protein